MNAGSRCLAFFDSSNIPHSAGEKVTPSISVDWTAEATGAKANKPTNWGLKLDMVNPTGTANFNSNSADIDCQGNSIIGPHTYGPPYGRETKNFGIYNNGKKPKKIKIRNCTISGFEKGIALTDCKSCTIGGISTTGTAAGRNVITSNTRYGISLNGPSTYNTKIQFNTITLNGDEGIHASPCTPNVPPGASADHCALGTDVVPFTYQVGSSYYPNLITNNKLNKNRNEAIYLLRANNVILDANSTTKTGNQNFGGDGIYVKHSGNGTSSLSVFLDGSGTCINRGIDGLNNSGVCVSNHLSTDDTVAVHINGASNGGVYSKIRAAGGQIKLSDNCGPSIGGGNNCSNDGGYSYFPIGNKIDKACINYMAFNNGDGNGVANRPCSAFMFAGNDVNGGANGNTTVTNSAVYMPSSGACAGGGGFHSLLNELANGDSDLSLHGSSFPIPYLWVSPNGLTTDPSGRINIQSTTLPAACQYSPFK